MRYLLIFLTIFCTHTHINAQNYLVFPSSVVALQKDLNFETCVEILRQNTANFDATNLQQAATFRKAGHQFQNLGKHDYAREAFQKVLDISQKVHGKNSLEYSNALLDLSCSYMLLIRYYEAAGMYQEIENIVRNIVGENDWNYWHVLNENAIVYAKTKEWHKAKNSCLKAIDLMDKTQYQNPLHRAIVYNNLGAVYKNQWKFAKALEAYSTAMQLAKNIPSIQISIAANLAEVHAWIGNAKDARSLLRQYKPIAMQQHAGKNLINARIWTQYGNAYAVLKDFEKANNCFIKAFETNSANLQEIDNIPDLAEDLMFNNDFLATCAQAGVMMYSIEMYKQMYEASQDVHTLLEGYKIIKAMTKYGESLMDSYLSEDNKLILFKLGAAILFDRSIYFAHELFKQTGNEKYLRDAFFYAERSKSTLLVNALRSKEKQSLIMLPDTVQKMETQLKEQLLDLKKRQIECFNEDELEQIQSSINNISRSIERFKLELMEQYPNYFKCRYDIGLGNLDAVQDYLAQNNAVLIEYALGVEMHYVFVISKDSLRLIPLNIDPKEDKHHTVHLRKVLTQYSYIKQSPSEANSLYQEAAHYFYKTYLQTALDGIPKGKHLIIIPDQHLAHLPFEAFLSAPSDQHTTVQNYPYLLRNFPLSYNYSATIMLGQDKRKKKSMTGNKGVLAFAASYPPIASNSNNNRGASSTLRDGLTPLPGATAEVEMMRKVLPGAFFSGKNANEHNFKQHAKNYNIIHLAMHGLLDTKHPILSSLVFTDDSSEKEDNYLKAYEIAQMDIDADLVVLSACETGYGKFQQGEGVMSLAHSFAYAGATAVLMSLWQVNDYSTSKIMASYYDNLKAGQSKEVALRDAKLDYLDQNEDQFTQNPAFWAAFVQTGNTTPVEWATDDKGYDMHYIIAAIVTLLAGFLLIIFKLKTK